MPRSPQRPGPQGAPRVSLLASARVIDDPELRWDTGGIEYGPTGCAGGGVFDPCAVSSLTVAARPSSVLVNPFGVWAGDRCSSWGFEEADYEGRARSLLEASESKSIAAELWSGTQAIASGWSNARLASPASDVVNVSDGPLGVVNALACLERGLASCSTGERGTIHATRDVVTHWQAAGLLHREGPLVLTVNDTIVVPDAGYPGTGPNGEPAVTGSVWAYGTGLVTIYRGPIDVTPTTMREALDRSANTVTFRASRLAMATWDQCCHLAVEIDVVVCGVGGS